MTNGTGLKKHTGRNISMVKDLINSRLIIP
jgi:hypothetical protein